MATHALVVILIIFLHVWQKKKILEWQNILAQKPALGKKTSCEGRKYAYGNCEGGILPTMYNDLLTSLSQTVTSDTDASRITCIMLQGHISSSKATDLAMRQDACLIPSAVIYLSIEVAVLCGSLWQPK